MVMAPWATKRILIFLLYATSDAYRSNQDDVINVSSSPSSSESRPRSSSPSSSISRPNPSSASRPTSRPRSSGPSSKTSRPRSASPSRAASRSNSSSPSMSASRSESSSSPPQHRTDEYVKVKDLGEGNDGIAYLLQRVDDDDPSNLKVVKYVDRKQYRSIEREVMSMNLPFVADLDQITEEGEDEKFVSIVTRYYEGGNLLDHMKKKGKLDITQVKLWGSQIAYGLWQLHRKQVLYADAKLENTFITKGNVVLADFGLSTHPCPNKRGWACESERKGSPAYVAPSIIEGGPYGYEVDWWALGVMLFSMREGQRLFLGNNNAEIFKNIKKRDPELSSRCRSSEPVFRQLLEKILSKKAFKKLETDDARIQMIDKASVHPILKHHFWHGQTDESTIDRYWYDVCKNYSIHKDNCVEVTGQPDWARRYPASDVKKASKSLDAEEIELTCSGVECKLFPFSFKGLFG
eukprot:TRINITY_DN4539_c0_g3_i1.p1 TRINITY_DN4539_c0_g3~~TRINITY_DN4539_c0_g3_i1.p1  ORF type:complete len:464 (-),score=45.25 TRINITY_DN4539_c0_g3_i1:34-1425(-)